MGCHMTSSTPIFVKLTEYHYDISKKCLCEFQSDCFTQTKVMIKTIFFTFNIAEIGTRQDMPSV